MRDCAPSGYHAPMTRLARYRELLARLEPTGPKDFGRLPGIHAPPASRLPTKLASSLALKPTSSHLLVGAIGSGKTTTALDAVAKLKEQVRETGDWVEYIDVSREHRLDEEPLGGVLLALAGKALIRRAQHARVPPPHEAIERLTIHANGFSEWVQYDDWHEGNREPPDDDWTVGQYVRRHGAIRPPTKPSSRFARLADDLSTLRELGDEGRNVVFVFDSLDRLLETDRFRSAVEHDLPVLKAAGIGVVVVGPFRFGLSTDRTVASWFDEIHVVENLNLDYVGGAMFLHQVLRNRATSDMISIECAGGIVGACGGIGRDLLSIAQRAATEGYEAGHESVELTDVDAAVLALGSAKAVGLDDRSLKTLMGVEAGVPFVLEDNLPMAERGQVVQTGVGEWSVHPALSLFLQRVAKAA